MFLVCGCCWGLDNCPAELNRGDGRFSTEPEFEGEVQNNVDVVM